MFEDVLTADSTSFQNPATTVAKKGELFTLACRSRLCRLYASRLNLTDPCGSLSDTPLPANLRLFANLKVPFAEDGYRRNSPDPVMAAHPTIPMRTCLETAYSFLAQEVVDGGANSGFSSKDSNTAIGSMVSNLMNVEGPAASDVSAALQDHFTAAQAQKATATTALRSTFVAACLSPQV